MASGPAPWTVDGPNREWIMDVLSQLWIEVAQEVQVSESTILLRLVRQRIGELTLGQLKELLASPAGRRLHGRCIKDLFSAGNDVSPPSDRRAQSEQVLMVAPPPRPTFRAHAGGATTDSTRAPRHAAATVAALQDTDGGLTLRELRASIGLSDEQVRRVLAHLMKTGQVVRTGRSINTRYMATATRPRDDPRDSRMIQQSSACAAT
jgi:hypothetical protein